MVINLKKNDQRSYLLLVSQFLLEINIVFYFSQFNILHRIPLLLWITHKLHIVNVNKNNARSKKKGIEKTFHSRITLHRETHISVISYTRE